MKRINLLDYLVVSILVMFAVLVVVTFRGVDKTYIKAVLVTVKVEQNADVIYPEVVKSKTVYFDSVNQPVEEVSAVKKENTIYITLKSTGLIEEDKAVFNGVRVMIGQKAEIHGNYFAQGVISEIKYAN